MLVRPIGPGKRHDAVADTQGAQGVAVVGGLVLPAFVGRDDDVITSAGYRIGPSEIEDVLLKHPAVAAAGVIGKPDPLRTEIVKAYVVLREGAAVTEADRTALSAALVGRVRERLSPHLAPREVRYAAALPMTATGKIQRRALREAAVAPAPDPEGR